MNVIRFVTVFTFLITLTSCQSSPKRRPPTAAGANVQTDYKAAQAAWQKGDSKKALPRLKKIMDQHPESDLADDAAVLTGDILSEQGQQDDALKYYDRVAKGDVETPLETQASLKAARALVRLQKSKEAIPYLERVAEAKAASPEEQLEANEIRYELLIQQKQPMEALDSLIILATQHPSPAKKDRYRQVAIDVMESKLSSDEVEKVANSSSYGFLQIPAKYRYALLSAEQRDYDRARRYFSEVASAAPESDLGERSRAIIQQIDARQKVDARTIGVVLPLSGRQSTIGYKALRGIQHGLGLYGKNPTSFRLAIIDSESNPDVARRAIERLVIDDNVVAIVGGLIAKTATAEASKANEFGVPMITLSQKAGITQIGDFVFRNALTSQMQVQRLVEIAMGQYGLSRFAVVYPNDPYGVEFSNLFWDEVRARGGSIQGAQPYDPNETDFNEYAQRLVGKFYVDEREDYQSQLKKWKEKNPTQSARKGGPTAQDILPPVVDFEAVFIPDTADKSLKVIPAFAYNDVSGMKFLGTNTWNTKKLVSEKDQRRIAEGLIFVDSFLATDRAFQNSEFFSSYRTIFNEEPGLTEVQGHDSALMLRQILGGGEDTRIGVAQKLARLKDFPGAIGLLTVTAEREVRRPVIGLTVQDGTISQLGAPRIAQ